MDTTILKLLFNYKGTITAREFRVGMAIVFLLIGVYVDLYLDKSLMSLMAGQKGTSWLIMETTYGYITQHYVPQLVPVLFIISYSSFILAMKRFRVLFANQIMAVVSGVLNYFFVTSLMALILLGVYSSNIADEMREIITYLTIISSALLVIGGGNFIYLILTLVEAPLPCTYPRRRLDASGYSLKMGNLMAIIASASLIVSIFFEYASAWLTLSLKGQVIGGLFLVVVIAFSLKYMAYRLKDAGISVLWLVGILVVYLLLFSLRIILNLYYLNGWTLCYNTLFSILKSFFVLAQFTLFLLPTKGNKNSLSDAC